MTELDTFLFFPVEMVQRLLSSLSSTFVYLQFATIIPLWRIFQRAGLRPYFSLLILFSYFGWIAVTVVLGIARWPNIDTSD